MMMNCVRSSAAAVACERAGGCSGCLPDGLPKWSSVATVACSQSVRAGGCGGEIVDSTVAVLGAPAAAVAR